MLVTFTVTMEEKHGRVKRYVGDIVKVLVTGGNGFIGQKAVAALRALWDARIKLRGHEQSPAMLYLVVAAIIDALSIPVFEENSSLLTFAEMESMINESA